MSTYSQRDEVWLIENCDEGLAELFQSTVREQMLSSDCFDKWSKSASVKKRHTQTFALPLPPSHGASPSRLSAQQSFLRVSARSLVAEQKHKRKSAAATMQSLTGFNSRALTLMKFEFPTVSWTSSNRTWGSPSSRPMWYDFSGSEVRIRLRRTFSGWWICHVSWTKPPVSWPNKQRN